MMQKEQQNTGKQTRGFEVSEESKGGLNNYIARED